MKNKNYAIVFLIVFVIFLTPYLFAGSINATFDSGLDGGTLYGCAIRTGNAIRLTPASGSQLGGLSFSELDPGQSVISWSAEFDFYIGGGSGADGLSLSFANVGSVGAIGEEGQTTGIAIGFDTYRHCLKII